MLFTHKTQFIYDKFLNWLLIRYNINNIHWESIMMDNEQAMISALNNNLPQLQINLCYFHVGQAIQRWISTHGLQIFYNENDSLLKIFVGIVRALGLLPVIDVLDGYNLIIESEHYQALMIRADELHLVNNINALTTYLRNNYMDPIKIPQWNVYALDDHRTNNDMEGYHHRLRERFVNRISNLWRFMLFMLKETCIMHGILERMRGGEVMQGRRRAYQRNEDRIQQYKDNYIHDHDKIAFLMNVRLCINN